MTLAGSFATQRWRHVSDLLWPVLTTSGIAAMVLSNTWLPSVQGFELHEERLN